MGWPFPMESAHPMVVHFPLALLTVGVGLDLLAMATRHESLRRVALWNVLLGVLSAGVAVLTGLRAEAVAKHSFEIHQIMELHERLGISTLILGVIVAGWRLTTRDRLATRSRLFVILLSAAMLGTLSWGAHLGGRLVYEFGVGGTFGRQMTPDASPHQH